MTCRTGARSASCGEAGVAVIGVAGLGRIALVALLAVVGLSSAADVALARGEPLPVPSEEELLWAETAVLGAEHAALHAARRRHARPRTAVATDSSSAADSVALLGVGDASVVGTVVGIRARCCCRMG
jgi:hypothetical protein